MKSSITIQALLEIYRNYKHEYLCWAIGNHILGKSDEDRDEEERKIQTAVFEFFSTFFVVQETQEAFSTIPMWFIAWCDREDDGVNSGFVSPKDETHERIPYKSGTASITLRIMMMEYILANFPEAVLTIEL